MINTKETLNEQNYVGMAIVQIVGAAVAAHVRANIEIEVRRKYHEGWDLQDTIAFYRCFECVNPKRDEYQAHLVMDLIRQKYDPVIHLGR